MGVNAYHGSRGTRYGYIASMVAFDIDGKRHYRIASMAKRRRRMVSPGAEALAKVIKDRELSQGDVQRAVGVASGVVCKWLDGTKKPSAKHAVVLERVYGIPYSAWWPDEAVASEARTGSEG